MVQEEQVQDEQVLGGTWRQYFTEDPEELFEYADRDYAFHTNTLSMMSSLNESQAEVRTQVQTSMARSQQVKSSTLYNRLTKPCMLRVRLSHAELNVPMPSPEASLCSCLWKS
jgi:hypothetical protein